MKFRTLYPARFVTCVDDLERQGKLRKDVLARVERETIITCLNTAASLATVPAIAVGVIITFGTYPLWVSVALVLTITLALATAIPSRKQRRDLSIEKNWQISIAALPYTTGTVYRAVLGEKIPRTSYMNYRKDDNSFRNWAYRSWGMWGAGGPWKLIAYLPDENGGKIVGSNVMIFAHAKYEELYEEIMPDRQIQIIFCGDDRQMGYLYSAAIEDLYNLSTDPLPHNKKETI